MENLDTITDVLQSGFEKLQAKFKTTSLVHLPELQQEILEWKANGFITPSFFQQNYGEFSFHPPATLPDAQSIIIIGVHQPMFPVEFFYQGKQYHSILGSNYVYSQIRLHCQELLSRVLATKGKTVAHATLPLKLLAVRSGLAQYGKNNISYIEGMGSFIRLEAYYTDYEFPVDDWHEKQLMKSCSNCSLCYHACPTHCIPKERILIHADRCLTHLNENKGEFPGWVNKHSHNALVGCMRCQLACPQNKEYRQMNAQSLVFTEEETATMLQNMPWEQVPKSLSEKLLSFDIDEYYPLLGRNLSVLINK